MGFDFTIGSRIPYSILHYETFLNWHIIYDQVKEVENVWIMVVAQNFKIIKIWYVLTGREFQDIRGLSRKSPTIVNITRVVCATSM